MGCCIGKTVIIYVYQVRRGDGRTLVNRQYVMGANAAIFLGQVLECWIIGDRMVTFKEVEERECEKIIARRYLRGGEWCIIVDPPFTNDGMICEVFADKKHMVPLGEHIITYIYDTPNRVKILHWQ